MSHDYIWGKVFQTGNNQHKGCKIRASLVSSQKTKEASTSGVERAKGRVMENEVER